jgi:hypothetical protein
VTCVGAGAVTHKGRVDFGRVAAAHLTGVLTAKAGREATSKKRFLDIQVLAPGHVILVRKKVLLAGSVLSAASLHALVEELVGVLRRAHGPEREAAPPPQALAVTPPESQVAPAAEAAPPPVPAATAVPAPVPVAAPAPVVVVPAPSVPAAASEAKAEPEAREAAQERPPALLEVEATLSLLNRQYGYSATAMNLTLRGASVPLLAEPGLRLGLFPVRASTGSLVAFGVEASFATAVGMTLQRDGDTSGTVFPAISFSASAALTARFRMSRTVRLGPLLGWQMMNFAVQKASDGTVLSGQPPVHWRALFVGLKVEADFNAWCGFFLEASYLFTYTAGPLTSAPYFTSSTPGLGFDTAVGLSFRASESLDVRLAFVLTRFAVVFTGPGPAPVSGASDQLLGGMLGLRYRY